MKTVFTIFLVLILQSAWAQSATDTSKVYTFVEEQPCYLDSITNECSTAALMKAIALNVILSKEDYESGKCGERICLSFVVEKDGSLSNFDLMGQQNICLEEQAIKILQQGPKWKPGKQRGQVVRVMFILPIRFEIR